MIAKRIRKRHRGARGSTPSLFARTDALTRYILDARVLPSPGLFGSVAGYLASVHAGQSWSGEKVATSGTVNLIGEDPTSWIMQMTAAATQCRRGRDPLEHFVLSWQAGEKPTNAQCREAVAITLASLGYSDCPAVWGAHSNTAHFHVHIALVRYDLCSGRVANPGWDVDCLHQAVARIEALQGWQAEANALYSIRDGELCERQTGKPVKWRNSGKGRRLRKREAERQEKPASLPAAIGQTFKQVRTWASGVSRGQGWNAQLQAKRKPHSEDSALVGYRSGEPDPGSEDEAFERYRAAYRFALRSLAEEERKLQRRLKANRAKSLALLADVTNNVLRACQRLAEEESKAVRRAIRQAYRKARARFVSQRLLRKAWTRAGGPTEPPALERPVVLLSADGGAKRAQVQPALPALHCREDGWAAQYCDRHGRAVFVDHRDLVIVQVPNPDNLNCALQLAASRWERVAVCGDAEHIDLVGRLAKSLQVHAVQIDGSSLQPVDQAEQPLPVPAGAKLANLAELEEHKALIGTFFYPFFEMSERLLRERTLLKKSVGPDGKIFYTAPTASKKDQALLMEGGLRQHGHNLLERVFRSQQSEIDRMKWYMGSHDPEEASVQIRSGDREALVNHLCAGASVWLDHPEVQAAIRNRREELEERRRRNPVVKSAQQSALPEESQSADQPPPGNIPVRSAEPIRSPSIDTSEDGLSPEQIAAWLASQKGRGR